MTVRPFSVVYCLALVLFSLKVAAASFAEPGAATPPGTRRTWLARNSSFVARSVYSTCVSRSLAVSRSSVEGTSRIYATISTPMRAGWPSMGAYVVVDGRALGRKSAPEEGPQERI
jgi:hypothetical protein